MTRFTPYGTVSTHPDFRDALRPGAERPPQPPAYLAPIVDRAVDHDLGEELAYLAWELVAMERRRLGDEDRRALFLLVLASLVNLHQGSTCLPVVGASVDAGGDYLGETLRTLIPRGAEDDEPVWEPGRVRRRIESLLVERRAEALVGEPGTFRPLIFDDGMVYHQRLLHYEDALVEAIVDRLNRQRAAVSTASLPDVYTAIHEHAPALASGAPMELTGEQEYAVLTALHTPFTLITGGPGTGKTSIVVTILRLLVRLGIAPQQIALAAPTGKAANRLSESIRGQLASLDPVPEADARIFEKLPEPQTLHRLLGYSPRTEQFFHHEHNRLSEAVVIVDEASMVDLFLMERLIRAVRDDANLVLLGDAEQLPSVDSGAVLRDLVPDSVHTSTPWREYVRGTMDDSTSEEPTARFSVRLRTSHRMRSDRAGGRHILEVARAINDGAADALLGEELALPRTTLEESFEREGVCLVPLEGARVRGALRSFVELWFERYIASAPGFDDADRPLDYDEDEGFEPGELERVSALYDGLLAARVLCLTRVRATGSRALDEAFVERTSTYRTGSARGHDPFLPGTPVMMLRNDYERNIFNGDQGVIWPVRLDGRVEKMAIFPRAETFVPFHLGGLRGTLEPSYAMTVHKSQGSEFRHVALVLPDEPLPLLTRELLYTAVTRSSHSVAILGDEQMLHTGVCRRMERFSRLGDKLDRFFGEDVEALP